MGSELKNIEQIRRVRHQFCTYELFMRTLKTMLTLLLAIVWLPISSHCLLFESAANLAILACCDNEATTSHHENACDSDGCAIVEEAQYRCSEERVVAPTLDIIVAFELPSSLETDSKPFQCLTHLNQGNWFISSPHWQFSFRTALSPRAPSFVS